MTVILLGTIFKAITSFGNNLMEGILWFRPLMLSQNLSGTSVIFLLSGLTIITTGLLILIIIYLRSKEKMRKLQKRNLELEVMIEQKNRFFSILAHDLKSPFNSLLGMSEMLSLHVDTLNNPEMHSYSKMMHQTTVKLYTLVDNLLQWSQTQMGTIKYAPEQLDLNILTGNIINLLRLAAQEKDIVIALNMENQLMAYADSNIYSSILRNLVNNAIKFSPVGSTIYVKGKKLRDGMIELNIKDNGVGMNEDQLEKAFNLMEINTTSGTFNEKGTGLGLILCKEFVEINRGSICLISEAGKGTSVSFTVPSFNMHAN
ncbi:sensor histidine kinase [Alkaliflexus imshenetskii]|uniref:sensor histidine kinase n=1 Tax=Alkaliflexus imshenetskii TaxID=286730 RepID=UPI0006942509|nr:HAMP domain-containing sensor histidine kinase [Alkaliflexus imshenetskii]